MDEKTYIYCKIQSICKEKEILFWQMYVGKSWMINVKFAIVFHYANQNSFLSPDWLSTKPYTGYP